MKILIPIVIGCLSLFPLLRAAETNTLTSTPPEIGAASATQEITVVSLSDAAVEKAATSGETIGKLLKEVPPTIGVTYRWGHSDLENGIDCSNYTWQLFKKVGLTYERYLNTLKMSTLKKGHGLHQVTFEEAAPGDLLVYGYRDDKDKWHGHVVIAIDVDGSTTGYTGLVLGAHGGAVGKVQFVTYKGFKSGYFRDQRLRLCNVLRSDDVDEEAESD
ncbi:MAG: hypothetical protein JWM68_4749 [Verrucomicrobiales bacterium]|nr:hypothetical protein [Verrucomicrobiales bacterium]